MRNIPSDYIEELRDHISSEIEGAEFGDCQELSVSKLKDGRLRIDILEEENRDGADVFTYVESYVLTLTPIISQKY